MGWTKSKHLPTRTKNRDFGPGGEKHCGKCGTCTERKEALEGFDPT